MVYGKVATSFRLMTEETAIKWKVPCSTSAKTITAGMMAYLDGTNAYVQPFPVSAVYPSRSLNGIAMDEYTTTLDDSQGSGFITLVLGPHVGATSQYSSFTAASVIGTTVGGPAVGGTAGKLDVPTASNEYEVVGNVLSCDGVFLTYFWKGK